MFSIDNTNTDGLGLYFRRDSIYNELGKLPKPKERFYNDWIDEHGKDYDTQSPTVYESLQYDAQCYLVAEGVADFQEKRASLLEILSRPDGFTLFSNTLGRGFHLRYLDSPSLRHLVPVWSGRRIYAEFTLRLENNFAPTETWFFLTDEADYVLTENNEYIEIAQTQRNF